MANEIYLRLDGVTGSSKNYTHRGWADIQSWHWGFERIQKSTSDGPREVTNLNRITINKAVGIDSPMMMKLFADRTIIDSAEISVAPAVGKREAQQKQIGITLNQVLIQSIDTGASISEDGYSEKVVLFFGKVKYEYFHYTSAVQGGAEAGSDSQEFEWAAKK